MDKQQKEEISPALQECIDAMTPKALEALEKLTGYFKT